MPAVLCRCVVIRQAFGLLAGKPRGLVDGLRRQRLADQMLHCRFRREGMTGGAGDADGDIGNAISIQPQRNGDTDHRVAARRMADLAIAELRARRGPCDMDSYQYFLGLKCCCHDVDEEIACRHASPSPWPGQLQFGIQRHDQRRPVRRGSALASDPPMVPRLRTCGSAITLAACRKIGSTSMQRLRRQQFGMGGQRADPDAVAVDLDAFEVVDTADVDQHRR